MLELAIIFLLIAANGVFAMSEIAVLASRKTRLRAMARTGDRNAQAALDLALAPSHFLSTVQCGITLVGVFAGVFAGATLAESIARRLQNVPALAAYADIIAVSAVVATITYFQLVFGELVPKRVAIERPEHIAARIATPMRILSVLVAPAVKLLALSTEICLWMLGTRGEGQPDASAEEVRVLMEEGKRLGIFDQVEQDLVERILTIGNRSVSTLMTLRKDIVWLDSEEPPDAIRTKVSNATFSSFPVCRGDLDNLLGMAETKTLLVGFLAGKPFSMTEVLRPAVYLPEQMTALAALEQLKKNRRHVGIVVDEYGAIQGLLSTSDILEAIAGEVEEGQPRTRRNPDGSWIIDGRVPIDECIERLALTELPAEGEGAYETLSGFLMTVLGRIPAPGDRYTWGGYEFVVLTMDGRRVGDVHISPVSSGANS